MRPRIITTIILGRTFKGGLTLLIDPEQKLTCNKYYEISPNIEVVSNQSHSFYYPPMIPMTNILDVEYIYDLNEVGIDYHKLLDYTMISDEDCMNIQFLFSEHPNHNNSKEYNVIQFLKCEGIFPTITNDHIYNIVDTINENTDINYNEI